MNIAIDISQIVYKGSGVARYTCSLIDALLAYDKKNQYILFFSSFRQKLNCALEKKINHPHILKKYPFPPTLLDFLWNRLHVFPIDKLVGKTDIVLTSDWTEPPSNAKKLTVIHDVVFLKFPETLPQKIIDVQKRRLRWVKKESALVITDSQSTKKDLIDLLHIHDEKIEVIYPAVNLNHPRGESALTPQGTRIILHNYRLTKPFIFTVGKQEPRKNMPRLISAFKNAKLNDIDLVIAGPKGWGNSYQEMDNIRYLGYVTDKELFALYSSALFFIYPSLYEGFGYPIVEAMSARCPVATSNTSSLKEIGKDSCLLFNPYNKESITTAIVNLVNDRDLRHTLKEKGMRRALDFSERKFVQQFLHVFNKIYDHRN